MIEWLFENGKYQKFLLPQATAIAKLFGKLIMWPILNGMNEFICGQDCRWSMQMWKHSIPKSNTKYVPINGITVLVQLLLLFHFYLLIIKPATSMANKAHIVWNCKVYRGWNGMENKFVTDFIMRAQRWYWRRQIERASHTQQPTKPTQTYIWSALATTLHI